MKIALLEASFTKIGANAADFSHSFYTRLFRQSPELEPLFADTDQQAQEKKLVFSLAAIVENIRNGSVLEPALKSLGARHFQVGTLEAHYPLVGQALLETFADYLGEEWTDELAAAWGEAYGAIAKIMLEGASQPEKHLEPELTFYEWIDLYGEESPQLRDSIAALTDFRYGNRPGPAETEDASLS